MSSTSDPSGEWIQWAVSSIMGIIVTVYGGIMGALYNSLEKVKDKQDQMGNNARSWIADGDDKLWEAIQKLTDNMEAAHKQSTVDRHNIMQNMVTRAEFDLQINRVVEAVQNRR